jgi:hypothetical protein
LKSACISRISDNSTDTTAVLPTSLRFGAPDLRANEGDHAMHAHLNERQLAERWNISVRTLQRWRPLGLGPAYLRLGGRVVYPLDDVEQYERDNKVTSGAGTPAAGGGS